MKSKLTFFCLLLLALGGLPGCGAETGSTEPSQDSGQDQDMGQGDAGEEPDPDLARGDMGEEPDAEVCPSGALGCACYNNRSCDEGLTCGALELCEPKEVCQPGSQGCACEDGACEGDLVCDPEDALCRPVECPAGSQGCACAGGACAPGLRCGEGNTCEDGAGFSGGACFEDESCRHGNRCQSGVCAPCSLGSQGCHCRDDDSCNPGLACDPQGLCVDGSGLALDVPGELRCYTPCTEGVELANGQFMACPSEGLMAGCFGGATCQQGQCLQPGQEARGCDSDLACPDFQTCLQGRCVSNCDTSDDCSQGSTCFRHVCREVCTVADEGQGCGQGQFCQLLDGESGVCKVSAPATGDSRQEPVQTFSLSADALDLGTPQGRAFVTLHNESRASVTFTLTRRNHRLFEEDGSVEDVILPSTGLCEGANCPLWWVELGSADEVAPQGAYWELTLGGGEQVEIYLDNGRGVSQARWQGQLEVSSPEGGSKILTVGRSDRPEGQWTGEAYYFGSFKDVGLDAWRQDKDNEQRLDEVENAFVRLWANFRQGRLSFEQLQAGLVATRTESWRSPRLASLGCDPGSVCFPFDNFDGFLTYTTDPLNIPVPSGVVEMPMALNLQPSVEPGCQGEGLCYTGRLESEQALQYAGQPELSLTFRDAPESCSDRGDGACLAFLDSLDVALSVGARYMTDAADVTCSGQPHLEHARVPWLLTGFEGRSELDPETGRRYLYDCRDTEAPLPGANPVPDGRLRYRNLELVDGALINNSTMFIIFRERLETFLWDNPNENNGIQGYGYMLLQKSSAILPQASFEGSQVPERDNRQRFLRPITCSDELLDQVGVTRRQLEGDPDTFAGLLTQAMLRGVTQDLGSLDLLDGQREAVHYLCEDTGLIDGGPGEDRASGPVELVACPEGSRVTFFTLSLEGEDAPLLNNCGSRSVEDCHQAFVASQPCQRSGSCKAQLMAWQQAGLYGVRLDPYYQCEDRNRVYCDDDRHDLREGKVFFGPNDEVSVFRPILTEVGDAFRYRTRFVNRSGTNLGFVPEVCIPGTELIPYCYDPAAIEEIRARVECAMELYTEHHQHLEEAERLALLDMLTENFAYGEETNVFGEPVQRRGFEFLDTELMIMLGDDHYTRALSSRFDLAQTQVSSFEGSLFEPNGINLSGVAGAEMHNLYKAAQYYQAALDRFYDLSPLVAGSVKNAREGGQPSFITPATVESWFGRLIRASTQKSRIWAEVAERYQNFNRPDLSRLVVERAYTATYLESMILTRLMQSIVDITAPEDLDQVLKQIEDAQRNYRVALAIMRQHYADISDDLNYFGFSPDFIPFPSLEGLSDTSFEVSLRRARARVDLAQTAENLALEADISFNSNAASFQNELARIQNTYDAQLSELCGTFEVDGQVFPAISKYAYLSPETQRVGDPCGLTGTGQLHQAMGQLDITLTEQRRIRQSMLNTLEEARIEEQRWNRSCNTTDAFARFNYRVSGQVNTLQHQVDRTRSKIAGIDRSLQDLATISQLSKCSLILGLASGGDCPSAIAVSIAYTATFAIYEFSRVQLDLELNNAEHETRELQRDIELRRNELQCDLTAIDGQARVKTILLRLSELSLESLKTEYEMNQVLSNIKQLRNQATRLQQEAAETEELTINVEAARNNPNVRIFRNDAILNADVTFYSALREVYKTTRVFEYYTAQSYAPLEQLFLTRLVSRGDYNLQLYLIELEDAFREFEDRFGQPSQRLEIISLKDDILAVPRLDVDNGGAPLSDGERARLFREQLTDARRLDENGYLTIPFSTSAEQLSPLTRNHKISHIEAEIIGGGQGDLLARVYLRMAGTSRVAPLGSSEPIYYTFPERLAVINPFFGGSKPERIDSAIYRNRRMVDRPFANSRWEFVLNTFDEPVNQDLNLQGLDDIRLYVYYNDFTEF